MGVTPGSGDLNNPILLFLVSQNGNKMLVTARARRLGNLSGVHTVYVGN
jgi:hypothetical protein